MSGIQVVRVLPYNKQYLVSANRRIHWSQRYETQAYWKGLALVMFKVAGRSLTFEKAHIDVTFHHPDRRRRDSHNLVPLVVKPIVDGIVGTGLMPDDDDKHLVGPDVRAILGSKEPGVVVTVTEVSE